ncbi:MAG: monovalent cation/H+ antiporter subunit D family protein, partial [Gammaproteobacteria bacterium]|nr:monovalent cation/H+ antiporter subunit D family protein [Gammaproteobacteria bacterium]
MHSYLPLWIVLTSLSCGLLIFFISESHSRLRTTLNLASATFKLALVLVLLDGLGEGRSYVVEYELLPDLVLSLRADALSVLFLTLSAFLWLATTVYAVGYLEKGTGRSRFFGFFGLCVSATAGISMAGNLFTMLLFYEALTIATFPLVVHRGTREAVAAGRVYLAYTLTGGMLVLVATVWLHALLGSVDFVEAGFAPLRELPQPVLIIAFFLLIMGFGVKAALFPLHGWLPRSMVAPAPVSALLHAVAVVKAGAFAIARVIYDLYGVEYAEQLGVLLPLSMLAGFTILYGSFRALNQRELKPRLAWSTVSQVSYIALGIATFGPIASIGGIAHLVHQGLMKITLFFCAGNLAEVSGIHRVDQMAGCGRRMPWTMAAFTLAALGMIGVPPLAGFVSKWYLANGALAAEQQWVIVVLVGST